MHIDTVGKTGWTHVWCYRCEGVGRPSGKVTMTDGDDGSVVREGDSLGGGGEAVDANVSHPDTSGANPKGLVKGLLKARHQGRNQ